MKLLKKLTALLLGAACLCALITVPTAEAAGTASTFPDVTDPQVGRAVEALRVMGVIDGSEDGRYNPDGNLTRAAFCKMAIMVMGKGDEADAQAGRTIFNDVPATHWARGYVNLAALTTVGGSEDGKDGARLMMGMGDGSFAPNRVISYGEAVTILLRMLGYAKQANLNWPNGAVSTAASIGLADGFTPPKAGAPVTRAQAALLFCNMLSSPISGDRETTYLKSQGCTVEPGSLLLASDTKTESGLSGAVRVFSVKGSHNDAAVLPAARNPASFLEGSRGTAVFDQKGRFLTFLPDRASASKTITVASVSNGVLTATDGTRFTPSGKTPVWKGGTSSEYAEAHIGLQAGTSITVCFTDSGAIDYLFVHGTSASLTGGVMVAWEKVSGNPFAQLTAGANDYKIVKNGAEVTTSALAQYDVAAYDPTNKTLYVTDFRLTGVYESASPNTAMPTSIRVLGMDLDVLDSAVNDLKKLKLDSSITLLLTPDGKVAGAVSSSTLRSNTIGYVSEGSERNPTVSLLNAPDNLSTVTGKYSGNLNACLDCLVTVTGGRNGEIYLSRISGRTSSKPLDLTTRTLGSAPLADNLAVFDRIASSGMKRISLADIAMETVPADKIAYQRTNPAGKVDLLVLDNATGDLYTYGIAKADKLESGSDGITYINYTTTVTNGKGSMTVVGGTRHKDNQFIGLAKSVTEEDVDGLPRSAGSVTLKSVEQRVSPSNFNLNTGIFFSRSIELPIWEGVQCYNAQTKTWFGAGDEKATPMDNLKACLAYSDRLTVYYDRDPGQGGKVRVVVAN